MTRSKDLDTIAPDDLSVEASAKSDEIIVSKPVEEIKEIPKEKIIKVNKKHCFAKDCLLLEMKERTAHKKINHLGILITDER